MGCIFLSELAKRVTMNPLFEFMDENTDDSMINFFTQLISAYSRVIMRSQKMSKGVLLQRAF